MTDVIRSALRPNRSVVGVRRAPPAAAHARSRERLRADKEYWVACP